MRKNNARKMSAFCDESTSSMHRTHKLFDATNNAEREEKKLHSGINENQGNQHGKKKFK